jgi:murein DD-endopeptidase MepM/ murein hydrolase activator NlpD
MDDEQQGEGYGSFGSGIVPVLRPRRSRFRPLVKIIAVFFIAAAIPFSLTGWGDFYQNFVEREPPIIEIKKPPVGLGLEPAQITIAVQDQNSGLDELMVRLEQPGRAETLLKKSYPTRIRSDEVQFSIDGRKYGMKEGDARLTVSAFDRSFWSNAARSALQLRVDYTKPELTPYADQHNAVRGGSELVLYRQKETVDTFSGVMVGDALYPGFPLKNYDKAFENYKNIYCVFFPVPRDFNDSTEQIRLFARDAVGNFSEASMSYRIAATSAKQSVTMLDPDLLTSKIDKLYEQYQSQQARLSGDVPGKVLPSDTDEQRIERFHVVNKEYRELMERAMKPLFGKPKAERFWEGTFAKFPGRELHGFGEHVQYKLGELLIGETVENGVSFAVGSDTQVRAANRGIVIFADNLGVFGNTVIIDHGFGLTTMYEHLQSIARLEGDRVERGDVVGLAGDSGLVFSPTLTFEVRLHGVPVRPIEWWDGSWMRDHVDLKIRNIKQTLGIRIVSPLS